MTHTSSHTICKYRRSVLIMFTVEHLVCVVLCETNFLLICEQSLETVIEQYDKVLASCSTISRGKKQSHKASHRTVLLKQTLPSAVSLSLLQKRCTLVCVLECFSPPCQLVSGDILLHEPPCLKNSCDRFVAALF